MNKKFKYILITILSFFIMNIYVYAADCNNYACAKCSYRSKSWEIVFDVQNDGSGGATVNFSHSKIDDSKMSYTFKQSIPATVFVENETNKLKCPEAVYYKTSANGLKAVVELDRDAFKVNNKTSRQHVELYKEDNNGKKLSDGNSSTHRTCEKTITTTDPSKRKVTIQITAVNGELKYEPNNIVVSSSNLKAEDFENGCPPWYVSCGSSGDKIVCSFSSTNDFSPHEYEADGGTDITEDKGQKIDDLPPVEEWKNPNCETLDTTACAKRQDCEVSGGSCVKAQVASNPCNEQSIRKTLRFFGNLLMIAKFMVPLIIIGFATIDLYKALVDKDEKSLNKKLRMVGIRILTGLIVFFMPTIVSAFLGLSEKTSVKNDEQYKICAECILEPTKKNLCKLDSD